MYKNVNDVDGALQVPLCRKVAGLLGRVFT
jgi:hypothetical protein